jgi:hypothetical protein
MLGPKTNERFELGINLQEAVAHPRIEAVPPGGMCPYVAALISPDDIDVKLIAVVKQAYEMAG